MRKRTTVGYYVWCPIYNIEAVETSGDASGSFLNISVIQNFTVTSENYGKFNVEKYEWQKGDRMRFMFKGSIDANGNEIFVTFADNLDFEIVAVQYPGDTEGGGTTYLHNDLGDYVYDQAGNKIKDQAQTLLVIPHFNYVLYGIDGDRLSTEKVIIQIYRPKKNVESGVYYGLSQSYPILNPHTDTRYHSGGTTGLLPGWDRDQAIGVPAQGTIESGDAYIIPRFMENDSFSAIFPCESMSYSDWYGSDSIGVGLANVENRNAYSQQFISNLRYSGTLIQDTRVNDLSRFMGSDFVTLPDKYGAINSMEEVGFVLKVLQKSKPSSLYIGRAGVTQPSAEGTEIMSSTKDVLGTLRQQESDYGTVHPYSVVTYNGRMCFFDYYAQAICRDAGNGIENLSDIYGISRDLRERCQLFASESDVDVIAAWDQENSLVLFTFLDLQTPGNSFTLGFRDQGGRERDAFTGFYQFTPDFYGWAKKTITSFKDNSLWIHNSKTAPRCNFYGAQYSYWVTVVANKLPLAVKRFFRMLISSPYMLGAPDPGDVAIEETGNNPTGQMSMLPEAQFESVQGKWVAEFGKNMESASDFAGLIDGDDLQGQSISVRLEGNQTVEHKILSVEFEGLTTKI